MHHDASLLVANQPDILVQGPVRVIDGPANRYALGFPLVIVTDEILDLRLSRRGDADRVAPEFCNDLGLAVIGLI